MNHIWLFWLVTGTWLDDFSHSYWECHHPNWRTHSIIFQRGWWRKTTNQILINDSLWNMNKLFWRSRATSVVLLRWSFCSWPLLRRSCHRIWQRWIASCCGIHWFWEQSMHALTSSVPWSLKILPANYLRLPNNFKGVMWYDKSSCTSTMRISNVDSWYIIMYIIHVHYVFCLTSYVFVFSTTYCCHSKLQHRDRWWLRSLPAICGQWKPPRRVCFGRPGGFGEAPIALASCAGVPQGPIGGTVDQWTKRGRGSLSHHLSPVCLVFCKEPSETLKLGDFVKASDFRDMKSKFIKGILPHNLYLTTVWGLRGVVSQLILVLVVAGCGWSMATSAFGQTPVVWHGSSTVAADHLWCGSGWWAIWGLTSNGGFLSHGGTPNIPQSSSI